MRMVLLFDLPMESAAERRDYSQFRKFLIKTGFIMLQKSVYSKLIANDTSAKLLLSSIRDKKPKSGSIFAFRITELQYSKMELILGEVKSEVLNSTAKVVII